MTTPRPHPAELPGSGAPSASGRARLLVGTLAVVTILWMLVWFGDTVAAMVAIWSKSDTFAHGFLTQKDDIAQQAIYAYYLGTDFRAPRERQDFGQPG